MKTKPTIITLSDAQLIAYNKGDIDAFCNCYHDDVVVLNEAGEESITGLEAFRESYGKMFAIYESKAWITERLCLGSHIVEKEYYQRRNNKTGEETSGEVIVRYTERDGEIAIVEFLR